MSRKAQAGPAIPVFIAPVDNDSSDDVGIISIRESYSPVGAHSSGLNIATAKTITKPDGATSIIIQALGQNVRYTIDHTTPTASIGFQLLAGDRPIVIAVSGADIKVIQESATASLQYQWIREL